MALALLASIGSDLAWDGWCHDLPAPLAVTSALQAACEDGDQDPCETVCVPDCFCCSRSTVAGPILVPPAARLIDVLEPPSAPGRRPGTLPLPDPPPLSPA